MSATYEAGPRGRRGSQPLALIDELPGPKRQPNLLFAVVRLLGGPVGRTRGRSATSWSRTGRRSRRELRPRHADERGRRGAPCCCPCSPRCRSRSRCSRSARPRGCASTPTGTATATATAPSATGEPCAGDARPTGPAAVPDATRGRLAGRHRPEPARRGRPRGRRVARALIWPEHATAGRGCARPRRSPQPTRRCSRGDLNELPALAAGPRPARRWSCSTPRCSLPRRAGAWTVRRPRARLPGHWVSIEGRKCSAAPGARRRRERQQRLVLALDGVQLAWAQPHGRAHPWVPDP